MPARAQACWQSQAISVVNVAREQQEKKEEAKEDGGQGRGLPPPLFPQG